ncbi:MAG: bifunctional phosphopantothenoylcysteine decarboxylase/phosphopantothenate--cysteine ligase CoaBC [Bdellovibrio sp.]|nr:MAG: bifunctional phosphopantothenoylcysteine decarboxylase/phosphopantothenate--cysteine ligase CoaBC [Bdellovibrio sp.]
MKTWNFSPPTPSSMGDHDVPQEGEHLQGKRIALMVCGGIAAMRAPMVARALRRYGADVVAYVSREALRYVTRDTLEWSTTNPVIEQLSPQSEHLSNEQPFDAYLVAPATYNTINKMRYGIADGTVTSSLATALGLMEKGKAQVLVAPTMHGDMHNSILTESLQKLQQMGVVIIPPRDDYGKHNIPQNEVLVAETIRALSDSPLKGRSVLVTGGPTPVPIDNVRRITNRFRGRLGIEIAKELYFRGAQVQLILGFAGVNPPSYLDTIKVSSYREYKETVLKALEQGAFWSGVFSAAVADYEPKTTYDGKLPSGGALQTLELQPTEKVIDLVQEKYPQLNLLSFKYQENLTHGDLMAIAHKRLEKGHVAVVANRGEEVGPQGEQVAYLVTKDHEQKAIGKRAIARMIGNFLEKL